MGRVVLVNGSRGAMAQAWAAYPDLRVIVITAPAEVLADRLAARGREGRADILARLLRGELPPPEGVPGVRIVNDDTAPPPAAGVARLLRARGAWRCSRGNSPAASSPHRHRSSSRKGCGTVLPKCATAAAIRWGLSVSDRRPVRVRWNWNSSMT